jgi:hypothetical protein
MNRKIKILLNFALIIAGVSGYPQTVDPPYEVGIWHGFRQTAINYTFDDGTPKQFTVAIPMFDEYNLKLTLFTVTNWSPNWTILQDAASEGHEVASHTVTHANFGDIDLSQQITELKDSKEAIESNIHGQQCITIAYPYCVKGVDSVCSKYYIAARGCQGFIEPSTPGSYMNISSLICGSLGSVKTLQHFKTKFEIAAASKGWCVFLLHGIDNDGGYSPLSSEILGSSLEYLSVRTSKFWVTTFKNAALYSMERDAVTVTETSDEDTIMTLQITDDLTDSIYNFPLTLRCPLPVDWPSADVVQNSDSVPERIVLVDSVVYLMFDVIPDAGEVIISRNKNYVEPEIDTLPVDTDTVPANIPGANNTLNEENTKILIVENNLILLTKSVSSKRLLINIYDLMGTCLLSQKVNTRGKGRSTIILPNHLIKSGIYIVKVTDGKVSWAKKVAVNI